MAMQRRMDFASVYIHTQQNLSTKSNFALAPISTLLSSYRIQAASSNEWHRHFWHAALIPLHFLCTYF